MFAGMRALKGLAGGLFLLAVCSGILLVSDWRRRTQPAAGIPRVSIFKFSSRNVLDESVRGCLDGLADRGYRDRRTLRARVYNAESDIPTANAIARAMLEDGCRLAITFSTPALQVMAGVNQAGNDKRRLRVEHLLEKFQALRRADRLDAGAAELLRRTYI